MTRRPLFLFARFFVFLIFAGVVFGLALPAEAQDPTIDWIKIYKIPDSALQAKANAAGDRPVVAGVWPPAGFTNDAYGRVGPDKWRVGAYGYVDGYVKIDGSTGEPLDEDGSPLDEVTAETILIADDILGIAIKINGPVNRVGASLDPDVLAGWRKGGPSGVSGSHQIHLNHFFDQSWHLDLPNNPDRISGTDNISKFTLLYCYRVRAGDQDLDGGWFTDNTPFLSGDLKADGRASVATTVQYSDYASIVYPKIDAIAPELAAWQDHPVRFVSSSGQEIPHAPRGGKSRLHEIRLDCIAHDLQRGDDYTPLCPHVDEDGYSKPALAESRQVYYYGEGDTIYISVKFTEAVTVAPGDPPTLALGGSTLYGKHADYHSGSGTDTLVFAYTVEAGDYRFSDIQLYSAFRHNYRDANARRIIDSSGNRFAGGGIDTQSALVAYFIGERTPAGWTYGGKSQRFHYNHILWSGDAAVRARLGEETSKMPLFLVDTLPATVWVPGLIKNGETHTDDKRNAVANLDAAYTEASVTDFDSDVTESETQTAAFDVEFRFFNRFDTNYHIKTVLADEVGESFEPADVSITGTGVTREAWQVELTYVGLDHRSSEQWPPPGHWTETLRDYDANDWKRQHYIRRWPGEFDPSPLRTYDALHYPPGSAKNSALFLVYKATITPALGFQGNVAISLPAGATQDIAGNASLASNVLTVPVDNPLRVVETPEIVAPPAGAYTAGDKIEVEVTYDRENLRYEGENPPYLTLYLGEEVPANARHAVWTASEDTNSTKVTFAYTVAATDTVAEAVRVPSVKILVPEETMLLSGPLTAPAERQIGTAEPAAASGTAPKTVPAVEPLPLEDTSGREVSPVVSDTPVVPYTPIFEETAPKAAASDVPRNPVVFNELGNGSGDSNDWLELRNVTGSAVSLKDWELSVVQDGKKEDTSLIVFPDVSVPANGLLLITNSDPTAEGNVLAGGDNLATAEVEKKGSTHLYLVNAGLSLPDDGKFLLILRNAKEKLGLNEAFIDVAGGGGSDTDAFVREQTGDYDTHVWPLQVLQAPGGDTEEALGSGKVWQRAKADIVGYHRDAWAESAFTGIGYDRQVTQSAATAGTPGYPNGAVKPGTATPKGSVTLSEIMLDSAGGTLPQWIELYNNSKTEVLNLNRWQLEIQNVVSEDLVGRPIVTLTLGEKVIQPNQTLLIVAGPARASSGSYLPADRVYDLLALHEKNLRIKRARDTFLSIEGFYLKLTDRNENLVDEVGNRDSDRRSDDAPAWALPMSVEEGSRSSVIRRYDNGVARPGQKRSSWVLAARVKKVASSSDALYWGDPDDIGTPGHREGGALPVELSSFSVTRNEVGAVVLTWTTESEVDNAGFNLRRSEKRASGFTLLNPVLIAGAGTTGERQTYTFTDTSAKPGIEYYYQIEEVAFDGKPETLVTRLLPGPVSAANRMLTTFGEVKRQK